MEEYYAVQDVRPTRDGGSEVDLLVGDEQWLQRLLLRLAPYAEVVSPPGFAAGTADAIRQALALYDGPPG
jgi:proteasome accessory factor C